MLEWCNGSHGRFKTCCSKERVSSSLTLSTKWEHIQSYQKTYICYMSIVAMCGVLTWWGVMRLMWRNTQEAEEISLEN